MTEYEWRVRIRLSIRTSVLCTRPGRVRSPGRHPERVGLTPFRETASVPVESFLNSKLSAPVILTLGEASAVAAASLHVTPTVSATMSNSLECVEFFFLAMT